MNPKPFTRLSLEQWQQIESGLSQKRFCQSHQISLAAFSNWKRKLDKVTSPYSISSPEFPDGDWLELSFEDPKSHFDDGWHMELELPSGVILHMRQ